MKATNHPSDKMTIKNNNGDLLLEIDAEGVQEIKFKDGSKYTGAEIDAAVAKAGDATKVTANPTLAGTEVALTGLQVGETKYKVEAGGGSGGIVPAGILTVPDAADFQYIEGLQVHIGANDTEINAVIIDSAMIADYQGGKIGGFIFGKEPVGTEIRNYNVAICMEIVRDRPISAPTNPLEGYVLTDSARLYGEAIYFKNAANYPIQTVAIISSDAPVAWHN